MFVCVCLCLSVSVLSDDGFELGECVVSVCILCLCVVRLSDVVFLYECM